MRQANGWGVTENLLSTASEIINSRIVNKYVREYMDSTKTAMKALNVMNNELPDFLKTPYTNTSSPSENTRDYLIQMIHSNHVSTFLSIKFNVLHKFVDPPTNVLPLKIMEIVFLLL